MTHKKELDSLDLLGYKTKNPCNPLLESFSAIFSQNP